MLTGPDPVFRWIRGTGARPVLQALPDGLREQFEAEYKALLAEAYPAGRTARCCRSAGSSWSRSGRQTGRDDELAEAATLSGPTLDWPRSGWPTLPTSWPPWARPLRRRRCWDT